MAEDRRIRYTKAVLKSSLIELMQEKPLSKITVKELCERADINRGTFYAHYKTPEDLMQAMRDELARDIESYLVDTVSKHEKLQAIHALEKSLEFVSKNCELCKALTKDPGNTAYWHGFVEHIYTKYASHWFGTLTEFSNDNYVYAFMTSGCLSVVLKWVDNDADEDVKEIVRVIINFTEKGMQYFSA